MCYGWRFSPEAGEVAFRMEQILDRLQSNRVRIWLEGAALKFRTTNGSVAPEDLAELRAHKQEIVAYLLSRQHRFANIATEKLNLCADGTEKAYFPMRVEQMWKAENALNGEAPSIPFDIVHTCMLGRGIRVELLRRAIFEVISKHTSLRSRVNVYHGRPTQFLTDISEETVDVFILNSSLLDAGSIPESAALKPINLHLENSIKFRILRDSDGNTGLIIRAHHYFCDHWSIRTLLREVEARYWVISRGKAVDEQAEVGQYCKYAEAQREGLRIQISETLSYWEKVLAAPGTIHGLTIVRAGT